MFTVCWKKGISRNTPCLANKAGTFNFAMRAVIPGCTLRNAMGSRPVFN